MKRDVLEWLTPSDPSVNYNIARKAYQKGTAVWFFESNKFKEWELIGSLIWIHGKRASLLSFAAQLLMVSPFA